MRLYDSQGNKEKDLYYTDFTELIKEYCRKRKSVSCDPLNPTIWVCGADGNSYVRVHGFQFPQPTPDNIRKYLDERIIAANDLLSGIHLAASKREEP